MPDKSELGNRYTCFTCGTKFYDLNRPAALCPDCNTDQTEAPVRDTRSILSRNSAGNRPAPEATPAEKEKEKEKEKAAETEAEGTDDEAEGDDESFEDVDLGLGDIEEGEEEEFGLLEDATEASTEDE